MLDLPPWRRVPHRQQDARCRAVAVPAREPRVGMCERELPAFAHVSYGGRVIDVKRVIASVREHGAEYGADPSTLILAGGSAGAHLAATAALTVGDATFQPGFETVDTSVSAVVAMYGYYGSAGSEGDVPEFPTRVRPRQGPTVPHHPWDARHARARRGRAPLRRRVGESIRPARCVRRASGHAAQLRLLPLVALSRCHRCSRVVRELRARTRGQRAMGTTTTESQEREDADAGTAYRLISPTVLSGAPAADSGIER